MLVFASVSALTRSAQPLTTASVAFCELSEMLAVVGEAGSFASALAGTEPAPPPAGAAVPVEGVNMETWAAEAEPTQAMAHVVPVAVLPPGDERPLERAFDSATEPLRAHHVALVAKEVGTALEVVAEDRLLNAGHVAVDAVARASIAAW